MITQVNALYVASKAGKTKGTGTLVLKPRGQEPWSFMDGFIARRTGKTSRFGDIQEGRFSWFLPLKSIGP
jgi:hypothetical protein